MARDWKCPHLGFFICLALFLAVFIPFNVPHIRFYDSTECEVAELISPQYCCSHFCDTISCSKFPENTQLCSELKDSIEQNDPMTCNSTVSTCPPPRPLSLICKSTFAGQCLTKSGKTVKPKMIQYALTCESCMDVVVNFTGKTSSGIRLNGQSRIAVQNTTNAAVVMESNKVGTTLNCFYDRYKPDKIYFKIPITEIPQSLGLCMICAVWLWFAMDLNHYWVQRIFGDIVPWVISYNIWVGLIVPLGVCLPVRVLALLSTSHETFFTILGVVFFAVGNFPFVVWMLAYTPLSHVSGSIYLAIFVAPAFIVWPLLSFISTLLYVGIFDVGLIALGFLSFAMLIGIAYTIAFLHWTPWKKVFLKFTEYTLVKHE